jgi:hypothetical protein
MAKVFDFLHVTNDVLTLNAIRVINEGTSA